jgi:hypothetical protein
VIECLPSKHEALVHTLVPPPPPKKDLSNSNFAPESGRVSKISFF